MQPAKKQWLYNYHIHTTPQLHFYAILQYLFSAMSPYKAMGALAGTLRPTKLKSPSVSVTSIMPVRKAIAARRCWFNKIWYMKPQCPSCAPSKAKRYCGKGNEQPV